VRPLLFPLVIYVSPREPNRVRVSARSVFTSTASASASGDGLTAASRWRHCHRASDRTIVVSTVVAHASVVAVSVDAEASVHCIAFVYCLVIVWCRVNLITIYLVIIG
jgi:hypothetical protein